jgi:hypothetical protein
MSIDFSTKNFLSFLDMMKNSVQVFCNSDNDEKKCDFFMMFEMVCCVSKKKSIFSVCHIIIFTTEIGFC